MPGRCPSDLEEGFIQDVAAGMSNRELGRKYGKAQRSIRGWKTRLRRDGKLKDGAGVHEPPGEKMKYAEEGNYAQASAQGERVQTLNQLLAAAEVDLEIWKVRDWGVKKWEVGAKSRKSDLTYSEGVVDGWVKEDGLVVAPLWSVWAKFIRREPVALHPVVQPVECGFKWRAPQLPVFGRDVKVALIGADLQVGFRKDWSTGRLEPSHDRGAMDLFLQLAQWLDPDRIILLGDNQDNAEWTDKFLRSPEFEHVTQPAIVELHWWLRQLREACPTAEITMHEGNHDLRMKHALMTHLRSAYGLKAADELNAPPALTPERLLALESLGIRWVGDYPNDEDWINSELRVLHGDVARAPAGATARDYVEKGDVSTIYGHVHRREMVARTIHRRRGIRIIEAGCPGCLCRIDGGVPGRRERQNWQQGLAIVEYDDDGHAAHSVPIHRGSMMYNNRRWTARDRLADLRRDAPGWQW